MASTTTTTTTAASPTSIPLPLEDKRKTVHEGDIVKLATSERDLLKGRNVSGRSWKVRPQRRASSLVKTKMNNRVASFAERQAQKRERQETVQLQSELREQRRLAKVTKRQRRLENERRRAENEFQQAQRAAQTLNVSKVGLTLKAMSKKQLRQIKKTRLNTKTGVVEYVPAYAK